MSGTHGTLGDRREGPGQQRRRHHLVGCRRVPPSTTWSFTDPATHATSFTYQARIIDTAGNVDTHTDSQAVTIDITAPTVAVNIVDSSLTSADTSSNVTFIFSELDQQLHVCRSHAGGRYDQRFHGLGRELLGDVYGDARIFTGTGSVTVNAGSYADAAGNTGATGSDTVAITGNQPPVAVDDNVITNIGFNSDINIPDWALLNNDTDANGNSLTITGVGNVQDGLDSARHSGTTTTFDDGFFFFFGTRGGSFDYTASDGHGGTDTGHVIVSDVSGSTLPGPPAATSSLAGPATTR